MRQRESRYCARIFPLGNGQSTKGNLYWGALYGLKTHFLKNAGWHRIENQETDDARILERLVMSIELERDTKMYEVILVADAWDGSHIKDALGHYMTMLAGNASEKMLIKDNRHALEIGSSAHLMAFIGHNGLMDFTLNPLPQSTTKGPARDAVVLACVSKDFFVDEIRRSGVNPLLLTTGLMAPKAYTLDPVVRAWFSNSSVTVHEAAASAYHRYQKCGIRAARGLFWSAND